MNKRIFWRTFAFLMALIYVIHGFTTWDLFPWSNVHEWPQDDRSFYITITVVAAWVAWVRSL